MSEPSHDPTITAVATVTATATVDSSACRGPPRARGRDLRRHGRGAAGRHGRRGVPGRPGRGSRSTTASTSTTSPPPSTSSGRWPANGSSRSAPGEDRSPSGWRCRAPTSSASTCRPASSRWRQAGRGERRGRLAPASCTARSRRSTPDPGWTEHFDAVIGNNVVHHFDRQTGDGQPGPPARPRRRAVFCEPVLFAPEAVRTARNSRLVTRRFPPHTHTPDERSLNQDRLRDHAPLLRRRAAGEPFQLLCRLQNFVELCDPHLEPPRVHRPHDAAHIPSSRRGCRMIVLTLDTRSRFRDQQPDQQLHTDHPPPGNPPPGHPLGEDPA